MILVVSDSSPLIALNQIGQLKLLHDLYGEVVVPDAVAAEVAPIERLGLSPSVSGNHHVYVECVQWLSMNSVKVKIGGYGDADPNGFTLFYEYTRGGSFRLPKRINTYPVK